MNSAQKPRWVGGIAGGLVLAGAWILGLWLVVIALFCAGVVFGRQRARKRTRTPARLAAWAVHAPHGTSPPAALEHAIAVDIAVVCWGHVECLHRARLAVEDQVDDPWRRALASERLANAYDLLASGCLAGVGAQVETGAARLRRSAVAMAMTVLVALGSFTQSRWWLLPLAVVSALLTLEFADLAERRRLLPGLLASEALQDPARGSFVMLETHVVRSIAALAGNDRLVLRRAQVLLEGVLEGVDVTAHDYARQRLVHAEALIPEEGSCRRGNGDPE